MRPPSRMAKRSSSVMAMGVINSADMVMLPGFDALRGLIVGFDSRWAIHGCPPALLEEEAMPSPKEEQTPQDQDA